MSLEHEPGNPYRRGYASLFEEDPEPLEAFGEVGARRRRPPVVRVVGFIAAASLLLATVGTTVGVLLGGTGGVTPLRATVLSVAAATGPVTAATPPARVEAVTFLVDNPTASPGPAFCRIVVTMAGRTVGALSGVLPGVVSGRRGTARVPIDRPAFAGTPADASVHCAVGSPGNPGAD